MIQRVEIFDKCPAGNYLGFDLIDILDLLGPEAADSVWEASMLECMGDSAEDLDSLADAKRRIPGARLIALAREIHQTIDGKFLGFELGSKVPWIEIKAVDSSWFEVATARQDILERIRFRFRMVRQAENQQNDD